jgi:hypothetical protein
MVTCQDEIIGNPLQNNFNANASTISIMDTTAVEQHWDLSLTGTVTPAAFTTAPSLFVEAPETLIFSVSVNANAAVPGGVNETFKSVDFPYLRFITNLYEKQDVYRVVPGTTNAAQYFESSPRLYFGDPVAIDSVTGKSAEARYWLDARLLSSAGLTLTLGWRDASGLFYGGVGGTYTMSAQTKVVIKSRHYFGIPNQTAQGQTIARQYMREVQQQFPVVATGVDQQFYNLRVGAILHRLVIKGLVAPTGTTVSFADPSSQPLGANLTRNEGPRVKLKVNNNALVPLDGTFNTIVKSYPKLFNLANANATLFNDWLVFEPSSAHSIQSMLNLRAAVNMTLWGDTTVASTPTSIQLSYVERVRPQ